MGGNVGALAPAAESLVGFPAVLSAASAQHAAIVGERAKEGGRGVDS